MTINLCNKYFFKQLNRLWFDLKKEPSFCWNSSVINNLDTDCYLLRFSLTLDLRVLKYFYILSRCLVQTKFPDFLAISWHYYFTSMTIWIILLCSLKESWNCLTTTSHTSQSPEILYVLLGILYEIFNFLRYFLDWISSDVLREEGLEKLFWIYK